MVKALSLDLRVRVLEAVAEGASHRAVAERFGVSAATFYAWKSKYGGMEVSDAKRLKALEAENAKLKRLLADAMLDVTALKDILGEKP